jgi:translation elongation factor EF-G
VVDVVEGVLMQMERLLRRGAEHAVPIMLVVNKVDTDRRAQAAATRRVSPPRARCTT